MEKENILEIEITKINDYWNAITVKKIKKDFESNDLLEWITIGGNYVCNDKIFINRVYPNTPFIAGNETTFIFKDIVDRINEKYGIHKRWRAEENEEYYFLDGKCEIWSTIEEKKKVDKTFFELGNYFKTKEEAQKVKIELDKFWKRVRAGEIGND